MKNKIKINTKLFSIKIIRQNKDKKNILEF